MENVLAVMALVISIVSGVFAGYTFFWTAKRDRKQATLEAYNRLQTEVFDHLNRYTDKQIAVICEDPTSDAYRTIGGYLARIEHFCVGINHKIYDRKVFYTLAHGYFDGYLVKEKLNVIIRTKNRRQNDKTVYYDDILKVVAWMETRAARE